MVMEEMNVKVGARFESDGFFGTVKFVGEIPGTKDLWLGVEWDDPSRGKHDGSKDGVRYFQTREATSGSFVRPKKVNLGISFLEALQERYGRIDDDNAGIVEEEMFVVGKGKQTAVEVVGAKSLNIQQSDFKTLREVSLRGELVSLAGPNGAIEKVVPNLRDLDVSSCLLHSWETVAEISSQLKNLCTLNVSDNRLAMPTEAKTFSKAFNQLKTLFLNRCAYDWQQVVDCAPLWPNLETFHACFNNITTICDPQPELQHIKLLNLESNPIGDWQRILHLGNLQHLETLILNNCGIESIAFADVQYGSTSKHFQSLQGLSLFHNKISEWSSINELTKLNKLEDLKFRFNPVTADFKNEEDVRYLVVAKIAKLKSFNRSKVDSETRKGAEVDYLKKYGEEWKKSGGNQDPSKNNPSEEFLINHPRYLPLVEKYGAPEDSELVQFSSALRNSLLEVVVECPNRPNKPALKKKIPETMLVGKLKAMLQRVYKGDPETLKLTYTSKEMPDRKIEFDNNMREIGFYAIEHGDVILVTW